MGQPKDGKEPGRFMVRERQIRREKLEAVFFFFNRPGSCFLRTIFLLLGVFRLVYVYLN